MNLINMTMPKAPQMPNVEFRFTTSASTIYTVDDLGTGLDNDMSVIGTHSSGEHMDSFWC